MSIVDRSKQNTPSFPPTRCQGLRKWKHSQPQTLFVLCGATGMRIGEALGLEIGKHISVNFLPLNIEQKARNTEDRGSP